MIDPLYIFKKEIRRFDGLTLFHLVPLLVAVLVIPIWKFWAIIIGSADIFSPPVWLDIPLRIFLAVSFGLLATHRFRKIHGDSPVRTRLVVGITVAAAILLLILQLVGVIDLT